MSGGHYDYAFSGMDSLASEIEHDCAKRLNPYDSHGWMIEPLPRDILQHMAFIASEIRKLAEAAHDIEWFLSGDYGEDTLRECCKSWKLSEHLRETGDE